MSITDRKPNAAFNRERKLLRVFELFFNFGGVWPLDKGAKATARFTFFTVYSTIQYTLQAIELIRVFHDLKLLVPCFMETTWSVMTLPKMIVMRFSKRLENLMNEMMNEMRDDEFDAVEQRNCYLEYSEKSISFSKILLLGTGACCGTHFGTSLAFQIIVSFTSNGTVPLIKPYQTYMFFEVDSFWKLWLFWFVETWNVWTQLFFSVSLALVVWLIYHVGGQLSALECRIRNLDIEIEENKQTIEATFRSIAQKHWDIKRMMNEINGIFYAIFLEELFVLTSMVIVTIYAVVADDDVVDSGKNVENAMIGLLMLALIYVPCAAGETILGESARLRDAYYDLRWYNLSEDHKKTVMLFMIGSLKPLELQGGSFFLFCYPSFISILKSAMSYLSVLRTIT